MAVCASCSNPVSNSDKFCLYCNAPLDSTVKSEGTNPFPSVLLVVGIGLALFGFVRLNSATSQLMSALGQTDGLAYILIIGGIFSAIVGVALLTSSNAQQKGVVAALWSPFTGQQTEAKQEQVIQVSPSDTITEQIRNLAKLKEEGILSEEEL